MYDTPLHSHHIQFQMNADTDGFIKDTHIHKNRAFNLVVLCQTCHNNIHNQKIIVNGYITSTKGRELDLIQT